MALLQPELFHLARENSDRADVARQVLMQTVNLRLFDAPESEERKGVIGKNFFEGEKLLKGCLVLQLEEDNTASRGSIKIIKDDIIGIQMEGV